MNFDTSELQKFDDLAGQWWDKSSESRPLHEINPLRLEWIGRWVPSLEGKKIADIGCGGGILAESMAIRGADVTGIDLAEQALKAAERHALEKGVPVRYLSMAAESLSALEPAQYDVVTCMEMLEHVPDPSAIVQACADLVKPGGHVFISTLNRNLKSFLFAIVGAEYLLRMLPRGTHEHSKFITPAELSNFARSAELSVEKMTGISYNPLFDRFRLSKDTSVNYLMTCTKPD
jgi:2-polyprenyl-6-hydroxyphenyl methylase/3-demethylubiquinone-9 3-methyltransferase